MGLYHTHIHYIVLQLLMTNKTANLDLLNTDMNCMSSFPLYYRECVSRIFPDTDAANADSAFS